VSATRYVTCKRCASRFEASRSDTRYCSNACRQAAHRKKFGRQRKRAAARKEREVALRARRAAAEADARAEIQAVWGPPPTPEEFAERRRREKIANLEWAIKTCDGIIERAVRTVAARHELQVELEALREESGA
jgi:hypothetical protein